MRRHPRCHKSQVARLGRLYWTQPHLRMCGPGAGAASAEALAQLHRITAVRVMLPVRVSFAFTSGVRWSTRCPLETESGHQNRASLRGFLSCLLPVVDAPVS